MFNFTKLTGDLGELVAVCYLRSKYYRILARNFTAKTGEIDIIATNYKHLVFVEVKSAWQDNPDYPLINRVNQQKLVRIRRTAEIYRNLHFRDFAQFRLKTQRLDVLTIDFSRFFRGDGGIGHFQDFCV